MRRRHAFRGYRYAQPTATNQIIPFGDGDADTPGRHAGDWKVAPTLHVCTIQHIGKYRYASSRSCRGEWKLARNTRNTYTTRRRRHARYTRGRPSSRPYTACTDNSTHCKTQLCLTANTLHVRTMQCIVKHRNASPRSCRGEWKLARNTRNTYISPARGIIHV